MRFTVTTRTDCRPDVTCPRMRSGAQGMPHPRKTELPWLQKIGVTSDVTLPTVAILIDSGNGFGMAGAAILLDIDAPCCDKRGSGRVPNRMRCIRHPSILFPCEVSAKLHWASGQSMHLRGRWHVAWNQFSVLRLHYMATGTKIRGARSGIEAGGPK